MGAQIPYRVKVLRLVEDEIVVSAVTTDEALDIARRDHAFKPVKAWPDGTDEPLEMGDWIARNTAYDL